MSEFERVRREVTTRGDAPATDRRRRGASRPDALPPDLGAAIEHLSGLAMDDVRVHRNSAAPAQLDARSYAAGREIHLGPGQEATLAHEAWHVVQQAEGRVRAGPRAAGVPVSRDHRLEEEADRMAARATRLRPMARAATTEPPVLSRPVAQLTADDALLFIKENDVEWSGDVSKKKVTAYATDETNPAHLREGLVAAWNKGANKGQLIKISSAATKLAGQSKTAEKAGEAAAEKQRGDGVLARALDEYGAQSATGVIDCQGFRLCGFKGGVAVAVSRVTSKAEVDVMKREKGISRKEHSDPYKWFSEAVSHTEAFQNASSGGSSAKIIIWLDGDRYASIRAAITHEASASGKAQNRFHREGVSVPYLINVGIHEAEESAFNAAMIKASDLVPGDGPAKTLTLHESKAAKPRAVRGTISSALVTELGEDGDVSDEGLSTMPGEPLSLAAPTDVPSVSGQEFLFAQTVGFGDVLAWKASPAYGLYLRARGNADKVPNDKVKALIEAMRETLEEV